MLAQDDTGTPVALLSHEVSSGHVVVLMRYELALILLLTVTSKIELVHK
jgi:hypothetical protein